ncbi:hypothetical protein SM11_pC1746 (plasmid) [Sinorhizobium meliloti SM11]|uniref:Uncharacterized protein n=1 Tax=Sinorhizobium meliloti (strain SM11) TaxID=707241 RepID=F7XDC4_SINMM|nr:hypothetical protein SM11_pC1746 [Sinorhizobium meliloti SM11]
MELQLVGPLQLCLFLHTRRDVSLQSELSATRFAGLPPHLSLNIIWQR